jgi:hypothetical protein
MTGGIMSHKELPLGDPATFLGETEMMDLSDLKDKTFIVAVNSGSRDTGKFIQETVHGPYNLPEMAEAVANMWKNDGHHAKAYILEKNPKIAPKFLDECTIDFCEARYADIAIEWILGEPADKEYTCKAGVIDGVQDGTNNE